MRKWALQTRYTLRHNTASIIKDLIYQQIQILWLWPLLAGLVHHFVDYEQQQT